MDFPESGDKLYYVAWYKNEDNETHFRICSLELVSRNRSWWKVRGTNGKLYNLNGGNTRTLPGGLGYSVSDTWDAALRSAACTLSGLMRAEAMGIRKTDVNEDWSTILSRFVDYSIIYAHGCGKLLGSLGVDSAKP